MRVSRATAIAWLAAAALSIGLVSLPVVAFAATSAVTIQNFAFAPMTITVHVGDTVTWTNKDSGVQHSAKFSDTFMTALLNTNQSGSLTFTTAGTFNYVCAVHPTLMSGTVIVVGAATPAPTPPPTAPPRTPAPTVRTPAPTAPPTQAPTAPPTVAPTDTPTPEPSATPTSSPTAAPVAAASPTVSASPAAAAVTPAPAATGQNPAPLIVGAAFGGVIVLGFVAFRLARRG
jgi:plastocyanin